MRPRKFVSLWLVVLLSMLILSACNSPATNTTSVSSTSAQTTVTPVTLPPETTPTTSPATKPAGMSPGTYLGLGNGRNGAIVVKVQVSENSLDSIDVVSSQETWNTGSIPISVYPDQILKTQSLDVDLISGATISSLALLNAVKDAISQAGGDPAKFTGKIPAPPAPQNAQTDVVVVGAGGAGMTAAIHAAKAGKRVILLEKLDIVGGTWNYSIEGFGAVGDKTHTGLGSDITTNALAETLTTGNPKGTAEAFKILAENNGAAADWLRSIGAPMTVAAGQTSVATSRETGELGVAIISALKHECEKLDVDIRTGSKATELVMQDGRISGVKVSAKSGDYTIEARAVILATGGFAANNDLVSKHYPALKGYSSSASVGATGDGHIMAEKIGAALDNMDYIRVNFTYTTADNGYFYYMGSLFNTGAIFVNNEGKRFVSDQGAYGVGLKVVEQGGKGWAIFDQSIVSAISDVRKYNELGLFTSADTIEELAAKIGVNEQNLKDTIEKYKGYVANGKDEEFNRPMLNMTFDEPPFYACPMTARVQGTFGGIQINWLFHSNDTGLSGS